MAGITVVRETVPLSTGQMSVAAESDKEFSKHKQAPAGRRKPPLKRSDRMRLC